MPNGLLKVGTFVCPAWPSAGLRTVVLSHCLSFIVRVPSPTAALSEQGRKKKKKYILLCFLPGMVLYQCMQFSQEETHNSFFARYPCGSGGERRCGTKQAIVPFCVTGKRESESLACKTNAVYHREGRSFSIPLHRVLTECA